MLKYSVLLGAPIELSHQVLDERVQGSARYFVLNLWPRDIPDATYPTTAAIWLANEVMAHVDTFANPRDVFNFTETYTHNQRSFLLALKLQGYFISQPEVYA